MSSQLHAHPSLARPTFTRRFATFLLIGLVFGLTGCGPKITVTWNSPKSEIREDTKLCLAGVEVGRVTAVRSEYGRFIVEARINRKRAADVKSEAIFLVRPSQTTAPAYIEVISPPSDSSPVRDGAILLGSDTETGARLHAVVSNWKPGVLLVVLAVFGVAVFVKMFTRAAAAIFCLGVGLVGAFFLSPYASPYLAGWVPEKFRPDLLAYGVGFLVAYVVAFLGLSLLRAPGAAARR